MSKPIERMNENGIPRVVVLYPPLPLTPQVAQLGIYDAHYLALAERLGAEFWTADRRLQQAVGATLLWVRLLDA